MNTFTEHDARWLALLIECEGTITINVKKVSYGLAYYAWVTMGMSEHPEILDKARNIIGEGKVLARKMPKNRTQYYLQYGSKQAANIIIQIYPYFLIKKRQANAALHLERTKTQKGKHGLTDETRELRRLLKNVTNKLNRFEEVHDFWVDDPPNLTPFKRNSNFRKHTTAP